MSEPWEEDITLAGQMGELMAKNSMLKIRITELENELDNIIANELNPVRMVEIAKEVRGNTK